MSKPLATITQAEIDAQEIEHYDHDISNSTVTGFWECECEEFFIHRNTVDEVGVCEKCNMREEEMPNPRLNDLQQLLEETK